MDKTLTVSLSRTFDGALLAVVGNLPGGGAELQPANRGRRTDGGAR